MTVREFLSTTTLTATEIAKACDVHVSQIGRWRKGKHEPTGFAAFKLMELSENRIQYVRRPRKRAA